MYKTPKFRKTSISTNQSVQGETIEQKLERILNNKEPITDGAPLIYTERKDGVSASFDIRHDKWDTAIDAMDKVAGSYELRRKEREEAKVIALNPEGKSTEADG